MESNKFGGIVVPIPSPCVECGDMDRAALERHFKALMEQPIDGMYLCGGTGDAEKLLPEERREIAALLVPELKKAKKTAIVHVGQANLRTAAALARHAGTVGADAVAAIPPRTSWQAARVFYEALATEGLPVFIYYIPGVTGLPASFADIAALLEMPGVAGIKVSDWNTFLIRQLKLAYPEKAVFTGFDEMLLPGLMAGADGSIGTWANLFPRLYTKMYAFAKEHDWERAQVLNERFTAFLAKGWGYGILPTFEALMAAKGTPQCFRQPPAWAPGNFPPGAVDELLAEAAVLKEFAAAV